MNKEMRKTRILQAKIELALVGGLALICVALFAAILLMIGGVFS